MKVISKQRNSKMCFICGMDNPIGLKAQFYNMEDGSVVTPFRFREEDQSFPNRVHGGLVSTMLDEMGLRAVWAKYGEDVFGVTMSIEVKLRKPVPYNEDLICRGIIVAETSRTYDIESKIIDKSGKVLANAKLVYFKATAEQIVGGGINPHEEMCYLIEDGITEIDI